jgi:hypothetical protein
MDILLRADDFIQHKLFGEKYVSWRLCVSALKISYFL